MNTLPAIVAAILTALAANLGSFDLSLSADQVQEGTFEGPPVSATACFACLPPAEMQSAVGQCRNQFYIETWRQRVWLWAPVTALDAPGHATVSRQLAAQAVQVLDNARANGATALWRCITWAVTAINFPPAAATDGSEWASAEVVITFSFRRLSGTGA